jgi:hypothetical protein
MGRLFCYLSHDLTTCILSSAERFYCGSSSASPLSGFRKPFPPESTSIPANSVAAFFVLKPSHQAPPGNPIFASHTLTPYEPLHTVHLGFRFALVFIVNTSQQFLGNQRTTLYHANTSVSIQRKSADH